MGDSPVTLKQALQLHKIGIATIVKNGQVFIEQDQKY
jgi:hypothetical protein